VNYTLLEDDYSSATTSFFYWFDHQSYDQYEWRFYNVNPASDVQTWQVGFDVNGGTTYAQTITSTSWTQYNNETDTTRASSYDTTMHLNQAADQQPLTKNIGSDSDQGTSGWLRLYLPHNTTYAKRFLAQCTSGHNAEYAQTYWTQGVVNTTSAIERVKFDLAAGGNIDARVQFFGIS
jgi:hypothetical protein